MSGFHPLTTAEQAAAYLRAELETGKISGTMPGVLLLEAELGINRKTVETALRLLEKEGVLVGQGAGLGRKIVLPDKPTPAGLRVAILDYSPPDKSEDYMIKLLHLLREAGHIPFFSDKTLVELGMNVGRVARFVKKTEADAWIVGAGSQEVLEWFSVQEVPAFALFGNYVGLPLAGTGPAKAAALAATTRHLTGQGHRRISFLCHRQLRLLEPSRVISTFLHALQAAGITTGTFNLPDWEESKEGFNSVLDSLFDGPTPPTALILDEVVFYHAAHHHLARRGLRVPEDVSLICTDPDPRLAWCEPTVAHIRWDARPVVRRVVRWANNVAHGKDDRRQSFTKAEFIEGGTAGPAPKSATES
jgi:hypothetical protein